MTTETKAAPKLLKVENMHVDLPTYAQFCIACEYKGLRYHIWADAQTRKLTDTLFKNPPLDAKYKPYSEHPDPRYFPTRYLKVTSEFSQRMIATMMYHIERDKLFEKAIAEREAHERAEEVERQKQVAIHRAKEAGPELLAALEAALPALEEGREFAGEVLDVAAQVREAIRLAKEGKPNANN